MKKILIAFVWSGVAFGADQKIFTDIAVDGTNKLFYYVDLENNPGSNVLVKNEAGETLVQYSFKTDESVARTEIELVSPEKLLILQQYESHWTIRSFEKENNGWKFVATEKQGQGYAANMVTVESGFTIDVKAPGENKTNTILVSNSKVISKVETQVLKVRLENELKKPDPVESPKGGIGLSAGILAGMGFSYRRHFENKFGFQVGGIGAGYDNGNFYNFGGQLIRTISRSEKVRLFVMTGGGVYSKTNSYEACRPVEPPDPVKGDPYPYVCDKTQQRTRTINFGGGIGFEFMFGKRLGITAELPLTWKYNTGAAPGTVRTKGPLPIPAASIIYYFGGK